MTVKIDRERRKRDHKLVAYVSEDFAAQATIQAEIEGRSVSGLIKRALADRIDSNVTVRPGKGPRGSG
jgi:hypothetical protein